MDYERVKVIFVFQVKALQYGSFLLWHAITESLPFVVTLGNVSQ